MINVYSKFFFARLFQLLSINLTINRKYLIVPITFSNMIYLYLLHVTAKIKHYQEGANI